MTEHSSLPGHDTWNVVWEFGPGLPWNNQFGLNGTTNRIYVRTNNPRAPNSRRRPKSPSPPAETYCDAPGARSDLESPW